MIKEQKYQCVYTSGEEIEYDEGIWKIITLTGKTTIIEKISEKGIYGSYEKGDKIKCRENNGNPLRNWGDGTFTIYPNQGGTPYYFKPIKLKCQTKTLRI